MKRIVLLALMMYLGFVLAAQTPEIFVQRGHTNILMSLAISPDGRYLISGGYDSIMILWDRQSGKQIRTFPSDYAKNLFFSPDGKTFMVFFGDSVMMVDANTGSIIMEMPVESSSSIFDAILSPDGKTILVTGVFIRETGSSCIQLLDSQSGAVISQYARNDRNGPNQPADASFTPEGHLVLWDLAEKTLNIIDFKQSKQICSLALPVLDLHRVSFSPDSHYAVLGCDISRGGKDVSVLQMWDLRQRKKDWEIPYDKTTEIRYLPDGKSFVVASKKRLELKWSHNGETVRSYADTQNQPYSVPLDISPDGQQMVASLTNWRDRHTDMHLLDLQGGDVVVAYKALSKSLQPSLLLGAKSVLISKNDRSAVVWDISQGRETRALNKPGEQVCFQFFSPDLRYQLIQRSKEPMQLWDYQSAQLLMTFPEGVSYRVNPVCSNDKKSIYFGINEGYHPETERLWGRLKKYDIPTGKMIYDVEVHTNYQSDDLGGGEKLYISPNGRYLIFSIGDGHIRIYDSVSGNLLHTIGKEKDDKGMLWNSPILLSPDGTELLTIFDDGTAKFWDYTSGRTLRSINLKDGSVSACYSADGKYLMTGGSSTELMLWEIATGKHVRTFKGHLDMICDVSISADGKYVLSTSLDGDIKLWDFQTGLELVHYTFFEDGEWVGVTPEGFYSASANGGQNLNVRIGNSVYSMDNFFETYYRPDIVQAKIEGRDIRQLTDASFTKGVKKPPLMSMSVMTKANIWESFSKAAEDIRITNGVIRIRVTGKDAGGGIKETRLFLNGKLLETEQRGLVQVAQYDYLKEYSVMLTSGENVLMILGFSDDMTQSNPVQVTISYLPAVLVKPNVHILAIGINIYQNSRYNLNYCVDDSKGFVNSLQPKASKLFDEVLVYSYHNDQVSRQIIVDQLNYIAANSKPEDVFILYYAGHGIAIPNESNESEFFFVLPAITQMTDLLQCRDKGLSAFDLRELARRIKANKQMMFIDACNSGSFAESFAFRGAAEENALAKLSRSTGTAIYAATTSEQFASEVKDLGHGIFTYSLIEAFSGSAINAEGLITNNSLKNYLDIRIPQLSMEYKTIEQFPTTFSIGQEFPIGLP